MQVRPPRARRPARSGTAGQSGGLILVWNYEYLVTGEELVLGCYGYVHPGHRDEHADDHVLPGEARRSSSCTAEVVGSPPARMWPPGGSDVLDVTLNVQPGEEFTYIAGCSAYLAHRRARASPSVVAAEPVSLWNLDHSAPIRTPGARPAAVGELPCCA